MMNQFRLLVVRQVLEGPGFVLIMGWKVSDWKEIFFHNRKTRYSYLYENNLSIYLPSVDLSFCFFDMKRKGNIFRPWKNMASITTNY